MRVFIVLCFVAVASAGLLPQDGYNYQAPESVSASVPSGSFASSSFRQQPANIITKNIYIHSAADDNDADDDVSLGGAGGHTNYNILFVKAPSPNTRSLANSLAKLQSNDKTVVYVLNRKTDASELQDALNQARAAPAKPEVFFIKYKTPAEAQLAQQQIKAQYDGLGGTTNVSDEGSHPVSSVIGSVGGSNGGSLGLGSAQVNNAYLPPNY